MSGMLCDRNAILYGHPLHQLRWYQRVSLGSWQPSQPNFHNSGQPHICTGQAGRADFNSLDSGTSGHYNKLYRISLSNVHLDPT
jgi:hypothetical protein